MGTARLFLPVAALVLTTLVGCWSPNVPKPKTEEDPLAGTELSPDELPVHNTAPPPKEQSEPDMEAINAAADRFTKEAQKNCNSTQYAGPRETARVDIVFMPNGHVEQVKLSPPHAGTPIGDCITQAYKSAIVPPFKGDPVTVDRTLDFTKKAEPEKKAPSEKK
jgi:hypothetical protein